MPAGCRHPAMHPAMLRRGLDASACPADGRASSSPVDCRDCPTVDPPAPLRGPGVPRVPPVAAAPHRHLRLPAAVWFHRPRPRRERVCGRSCVDRQPGLLRAAGTTAAYGVNCGVNCGVSRARVNCGIDREYEPAETPTPSPSFRTHFVSHGFRLQLPVCFINL